jgi:TatD DNase family protein
MIRLVDIGANLAHESFRHDLADVLARARAAGVDRLVITGTSVAGSAESASLAEGHPGTAWATAGVHPHHASEWDEGSHSRLLDLLHLPAVVAVGECGLDYHRNFSPREAQRLAFDAQLRLAVECGKPVFLHQRDAQGDFVELLRNYRSSLVAGVAHCFTGGIAELEQNLELGLHIGITGWICDERRGGELREAVARLPLDRVMLETDAPYLLPRSLKPPPAQRRNEPAFLPHVLETLAECMQRPPAVIAAATTANAVRFFGLEAVNGTG